MVLKKRFSQIKALSALILPVSPLKSAYSLLLLPVVFLLPCAVAAAESVQILTSSDSANFITYNSKDDAKARGINFDIEYPANWNSYESQDPDEVRWFANCRYDGRVFKGAYAGICVEQIPGDLIIEGYIRSFFPEGYAKWLIPEDAELLSYEKIQLGGYDAMLIEYRARREKTQEAAGIIDFYKNCDCVIFYKNYLITINTYTVTHSQSSIDGYFEEFKPLFTRIINSFTILNQSDDINSAAEKDSDSASSVDFAAYNSKDDAKARGLNFTIDYPASWETSDGAQISDTVCAFTDLKDDGLNSALIQIGQMPAPLIDALNNHTFFESFIKSELSEDYKFLNSRKIKLNGIDALLIESRHRENDGEFCRNIDCIIFYKNYLIRIAAFSASPSQSSANNYFEEAKPFFTKIINSFTILDK